MNVSKLMFLLLLTGGAFCVTAQDFITVDFENSRDISGRIVARDDNGTHGQGFINQPVDSKGVTITGGYVIWDFRSSPKLGYFESSSSYCICNHAVQFTFPPNATDISMDIDGAAQVQPDPRVPPAWVPLRVDNNGTVVASIGGTPRIGQPIFQNVYIGESAGQITVLAPVTGNGSYQIRIDNIRFRIRPLTPPLFQFEYDSNHPDERLLLHKYLASDHSGPVGNGYFSPYQVENVPIDQPPQFRIPGVVTLDGAPAVKTVYYRVLDPPDTAPYVPNPTVDDNRDPVRPKGTLFYIDGNGQRVNASSVQSNMDGVPGRAVIYLEASNHVAGENYQVEASFDSGFACATAGPGGTDICPKSVTVTTWKRLYVEEEHMLRRGAFLSHVFAAGTDRIPVTDTAPFANLASGEILQLVHADRSGEGYYFDFVKFNRVTIDPRLGGVLEIDATYGLTERDYGEEPPAGSRPTSVFQEVVRDGVGVVSEGAFESQNSYIDGLFHSMFVDIRDVGRLPFSEVPYVAQFDYTTALFFANRWFQTGVSTNAWVKRALPNVLHRIASRQTELVQDKTTQRYGAELGVTLVGSESNYSLILAGRIEDLVAGGVIDVNGNTVGAEYAGLSAVQAAGEIAAHETVHLWVRSGGADGSGHCTQERYQHDGLSCLMHVPYAGPGLADGLVALHYESVRGVVDSEYDDVRTALEPVSQH